MPDKDLDPDQAPEAVQEVAPEDDQDRVEDEPARMVEGEEESDRVGVGVGVGEGERVGVGVGVVRVVNDRDREVAKLPATS